METDGTPSSTGGQITLFHVLVVGLSLTLTLTAWIYTKKQVETRVEVRFQAARDRAVGLISDRMAKYEDALWSGVAAIVSHGGDVSYRQWRDFAQNLRIEQRYPGINGIGVIHHQTIDTFPSYLAGQQRTRPDFQVYPQHDFPDRMPITFIEPEDINVQAVGLDVAHEQNRRTAALASRDTGTAQITGPIVLVQDAGQTAGFLFYAPLYRSDPGNTVQGRRANFIGTVYAPFVVHKLMEGLLAKELRDVRFSIVDDGVTIYDEHQAEDPRNDPDPMFAEELSFQLYGRVWTLDIRSDLSFREANTYAEPTFILLGGLVIEALIVSLLILMARANKRAVVYADKVTAELRREQAKLVDANDKLNRKNEEIERFAYVASHDLKTPIRGISGLTEMVQEDLESYFASPTAVPDVSLNLKRIQDRVQRMDKLTTGIMELSRLESHASWQNSIRLSEVTNELATDLGIEPDQLLLEGEDLVVDADPVNFRSVLENLIGNAVKYHHDKNHMRVTVSARILEDQLTISVADNGPGIDPKFHSRIFDVFQTLGNGRGVESTGIGLAIVKKAVERHGGKVALESSPGDGATFTFTWPAVLRSDHLMKMDKAA